VWSRKTSRLKAARGMSKGASDHWFDAIISDVFDVEFIPPESVRHLASPMVALAGVSVLVF
jgi:hypothetical protein